MRVSFYYFITETPIAVPPHWDMGVVCELPVYSHPNEGVRSGNLYNSIQEKKIIF
jgi:hypothetical protein